MERIRFAVIGSGWRSLFYLRIAKALPKLFTIACVKVRNEEKKRAIEQDFNVHVVLSDEEVYTLRPEFVVVAVDKASLFTVSRQYLEAGIPVLCETPGAYGEEEVMSALSYNPKVPYGIAEQYFLYPEYSALIRLIESGIIGRPCGLYLSVCHDYHAVSLMRRLLLKNSHPRLVCSTAFPETVPGGFSRYSEQPDGNIESSMRRTALYEFETGEHVLYDFSSYEYHSPLRSISYRVEGEKGEILNGRVRWHDEGLKLHEAMLERRGEVITLEGMRLFENRFPGVELTSDEYAIALLLENFGKTVRGTEKLLYPAREALLDALSVTSTEFCQEA